MEDPIEYLVAGGANGIGYALAEKLSQAGNIVHVVDKAIPKVAVAGVIYYQCDLTSDLDLAEFLDTLPKQLSGCFWSVGVMARGTIFDVSNQQFDEIMRTNLKAAWSLLKGLEPRMAHNALLVTISSGYVLDPEPDPALYALSKMAMSSLVELVKLEKPDWDVRTIYPGPILTNLLLEGRNEEAIAAVSEIAFSTEAISTDILDLLSTEKRFLMFDPDSWTHKPADSYQVTIG